MSDWTLGYVADIGYTYGYYGELNPLRIKLAFANAGLVAPETGTACELGFGQGVSANIHAAASITTWYGTDFNPAQAGFAQEMAAASQAKLELHDQAFAEFCTRSDLPDFEFIGLHGIWSWISDENRGIIVDFIRRKLKVGGVLYISYNTLPGWAAFAPMRHLMTEHAEVLGAHGRGIVSRIDGAIEFADRMLGLNPIYAQANPQVASRVTRLKDMSRHYLAHEYFNRDWHPMHFATMAQWMEPAKVQFACSANLLDHVDAINLTDEQQAFLNDIPDTNFRQSVRDFMVNQQFRRDYWVKGARVMTPLDRLEFTRQLRVVLTTPRDSVPNKIEGARGEAQLNEAVYGPLLELLASHLPQTVGELESALAGRVGFAQLLQAILVLGGSGHLHLAQASERLTQVKPSCDRLNRSLMQKARSSNDINYLASPMTGGAVSLDRVQQLFVLARLEGFQDTSQWAQFAWSIFCAQGQKLIRDGQTLDDAESNLRELARLAEHFEAKTLPLLKAVAIA
jgi:SAM-dependent methyltransferase